MSHGVSADSIIFANPTKPTSHLLYAAEMDVRMMTVDGDFELHKIHKHFPSARYEHTTNICYSLYRIHLQFQLNGNNLFIFLYCQSGATHTM